MLREILLELFERDLSKLKDEVNSYKSETNIWKTERAISNSAGNLVLHLCGNLKLFIGSTLGKFRYERDRESEFNVKNVPIESLVKNIEETLLIVKATLLDMKQEDFEKAYPLKVLGKEMTTSYFLVHLLSHLNYHLGQVNYHRRLIE
ncbi:DinB family protein [Melioribacteraceae bacterium 4301-Me]|uniref:DinB family protein n=1 Tax=Pyranulibacter aquaticus TaxID=3163344 RepID=UPI00359818C1